MALSANTAWEVRPTNGLDTNGGGFVAGASGTDWSQQNAPQYSVTDGVTAGTTTITSASAAFGTDVVGNIIYVQGGTGSVVAGWYQIVSRTNATTIVVDRATGLTAGTGVTLHIGGALQTLAKAASLYVISNKIFCKAEATHTTNASIAFTTGGTPASSTPLSRIIGYTSARTDKGQFTVQLITNTGLTALNNSSGNGVSFENITVDCNSLGTSVGISITGSYSRAVNCVVKNFTSKGIEGGSATANYVLGCEVTAGTSAASMGVNVVYGVIRSNIHDNACTGIVLPATSGIALQNLVTNNTGATSDGIQFNYGNVVVANTIKGSGRDNIRSINGYYMNIFYNNLSTDAGVTAAAGYGLNNPGGAGLPADIYWDGNGYYNNKTAARNNYDDTSTNAIDGVSPYTNTLDKTISGSPYVSSSDFELNATAGAGGTARAGGLPGTLLNATGTGYHDLGAWQHQDSGSGVAGMLSRPEMGLV